MKAIHAGSSSFLFLPKKHCDERLRSYRKLSTFSLQNSSPGGIGNRNWNFSANSYFEDRSIAVLQKLKDKWRFNFLNEMQRWIWNWNEFLGFALFMLIVQSTQHFHQSPVASTVKLPDEKILDKAERDGWAENTNDLSVQYCLRCVGIAQFVSPSLRHIVISYSPDTKVLMTF